MPEQLQILPSLKIFSLKKKFALIAVSAFDLFCLGRIINGS